MSNGRNIRRHIDHIIIRHSPKEVSNMDTFILETDENNLEHRNEDVTIQEAIIPTPNINIEPVSTALTRTDTCVVP